MNGDVLGSRYVSSSALLEGTIMVPDGVQV